MFVSPSTDKMKYLCVVLLLVFTGLEASPTELFVPVFKQTYGSGETRIIHGDEAEKNQFPYQAAVTIDGRVFCGGSLISKTWVLTAAHCVKPYSQWSVGLGLHDRTQAQTPGSITITSMNAVHHESYRPVGLVNDVGLINLPREVSLNEQVNIIALPPLSYVNKDFAGKTGRVSGWGKTEDGDTPQPTKLQYADLVIISLPDCRKTYLSVSDTSFCCIGKSLESTCSGDSGGSLTVGSGKNLTHLGIASFVSGRGCAKGYPSGYTRTPLFLDWISSKTGIHINDY